MHNECSWGLTGSLASLEHKSYLGLGLQAMYLKINTTLQLFNILIKNGRSISQITKNKKLGELSMWHRLNDCNT